MGAAAGVFDGEEASYSNVEVSLLQLPLALEEASNVIEKFAIIIDPSQQAHRYLKYQPGAYFNYNDPLYTTKASLHCSLISCMQLGRTLTLVINDFHDLHTDACFDPDLFPVEIIDRLVFFQPEVWQSMIHPENGDPPLEEILLSTQFQFVICTTSTSVPPLLESKMHKIRILQKPQSSSVESEGNHVTDDLNPISAMYGVQEVVRNSIDLVEAAFEGEMSTVQDLLAKGYHIESCDGRKHTALSEAASQGHLELVKYLLDVGADPNAVSDTNRSPLWRAAFNSHLPVIQVLLEAGANPESRDTTSMESAYDIANDECKELLVHQQFFK